MPSLALPVVVNLNAHIKLMPPNWVFEDCISLNLVRDGNWLAQLASASEGLNVPLLMIFQCCPIALRCVTGRDLVASGEGVEKENNIIRIIRDSAGRCSGMGPCSGFRNNVTTDRLLILPSSFPTTTMNHYAGSLPSLPPTVGSQMYRAILTCLDADTLFLRFLQGNDNDPIPILRDLVEKYRQAAGLALDEPGSLVIIKDRLAVALLFLFEHNGTMDYVKESIDLHRQTLLARSKTGLDTSPSSCGIAAGMVAQAMAASERPVLRECLQEAIRIVRQAISDQRSEGPHRVALNSALTMYLLRWVKLFEGNSELEEADKVSLNTMSIPVSHLYSDSIRQLARASFLRVKYEVSGNHRDLQDAITLLRNIVQLFSYAHTPPDADPLRVLCICLQFRSEALSNQADLDESIEISRLLFTRCPSSHINRAQYVETLTSSLGVRYDSTENLDDLDEIIHLQRGIYQGGAGSNSGAVNLGIALRYRYMATGRLSDLDETLDIFQQAEAANPENITDRVGCLGSSAMLTSCALRRRKVARTCSVPSITSPRVIISTHLAPNTLTHPAQPMA
jgi:tetratricopeptide (TPR) repeat protein